MRSITYVIEIGTERTVGAVTTLELPDAVREGNLVGLVEVVSEGSRREDREVKPKL